jgi:outer membrane protein TolC
VKTLPRLAVCALAGVLASTLAWAQPTATPDTVAAIAQPATAGSISLRDALAAAWKRAVAASEVAGQQSRAQAERITANRLWADAPTLEISHRDDRPMGGSGQRETAIDIALPVWLPGQRAAASDAAQAAANQAQAQQQAARLRLAGELREAAWQIAALRAEADQAEAQVSASQALAEDVERRVKAGDLARADSLATRAEHLEAKAALAEVRQRLRAALIRWTLLTGLHTAPELGHEPEDHAPQALAAQREDHPEWRLARLSTELALRRVDVLRQTRRDPPELTLGVRQDQSGRGQALEGSVVIGLRLPFGADGRNQQQLVAALAELDTARTHEMRLRERLDSDIAEAHQALIANGERARNEAERTRLLRDRAALIDKSFRAGESPLPQLLMARAAAAQAETALARLNAALGLARARLHQAQGVLP